MTNIMKIFLLLIILLLIFTSIESANAARPAIEWNQTYESTAIHDVSFFRQTTDSGYIIAAITMNRKDLLLLKTNAAGQEQWRTILEGSKIRTGVNLAQTSDNGYIITGTTKKCESCSNEIWLAKIDPEGNEQWNRTTSPVSSFPTRMECSVRETSDHGYLLGGIFYDGGSEYSAYWLMRTDARGYELWNRTFQGGDYKVTSQLFTSDGNTLFAGTEKPDSFWMITKDSEGNELENLTIEGFPGHFDLFQSTPDGGYIIGDAFWFKKIDSTGNILFEKDLDGIWLKSIQQTADGGYMLTGYMRYSDDAFGGDYIVKTDVYGVEQWNWFLEELRDVHQEVESILQTFDGGYIIVKQLYIYDSEKSYIQLTKLEKESPEPSGFFSYDPYYPGENQKIAFDGSRSYDLDGNITGHYWDFGDGTQAGSEGPVIMHSYTTQGNYTVSLTITDDDGNKTVTSKPIIIQKISPVEDWSRTYGGKGTSNLYAMDQTSDGGYILGGNTCNGGAWCWPYNIMLVKIDRIGNKEWNKTYTNKFSEFVNSIMQTSDGGYIIGGSRHEDGRSDILLIKTDRDGNEQWTKIFDGVFSNSEYTIKETGDGGFVLAGARSWYGNEPYDLWLIRTDSQGNELSGQVVEKMTGPANYIAQTSEGGYIVTGRQEYTISDSETWIAKIDLNGTEQWNGTYGKNSNYNVHLVRQTLDGGYIISGNIWQSSESSFDIFLLKTDPEGNEQWNRTFGGTGDNMINYVQQTSDGGYIFAGNTAWWGEHTYELDQSVRKVWIMKTDGYGNMEWQTSFGGGYDRVNLIQETSNGSYLLGGNKKTEEGTEFWLMQLSGIHIKSGEKAVQFEDKQAGSNKIPGLQLAIALGSLTWTYLLLRRKK
jgi:PKD repeat protein